MLFWDIRFILFYLFLIRMFLNYQVIVIIHGSYLRMVLCSNEWGDTQVLMHLDFHSVKVKDLQDQPPNLQSEEKDSADNIWAPDDTRRKHESKNQWLFDWLAKITSIERCLISIANRNLSYLSPTTSIIALSITISRYQS